MPIHGALTAPVAKATIRSSPGSSPRWLGWATAEALVAFVLAMFRIDARSLWYDEAVSALASGSSMRELERVARTFDPNMSGYHVVLNLWQRAFGDSEVALRSLSAVSIAVAVVVMVALGTRLHDERTGLVAGLILAVAPFVVRYGQEARSYALEVLVVTTATYLFVRVVDGTDGGSAPAWPALAYGATAAFGCYVHMYTVFVLAAHVVSLVLVDPTRVPWRRLRQSALLFATLLVPMLLWLAAGPSEHLQWIRRPEPGDLLAVARHITGGGVVAAVLVGLVVVASVRWHRTFTRSARPRSEGRATWADGLGLLWVTCPFVLSALISFTVKPIFLDRYLIVCVPALALVAATVLARLRARPVAVGLLTIVVAGSLVTVGRSYGGHRTDWRDAIAYFGAYATPADGVVVCPPRARLPVTYYVNRIIRPEFRPTPLSPPDAWDTGFRVAGVTPVAASEWIAGGPRRIWVLGRVERCGFSFPGRVHNVSVRFAGMVVERYDR